MISFSINLLAFAIFVFLGSLCMCGIYKATREQMLLAGWSKYWEEKRSNGEYVHGKIVKAVSSCIYCYASVYGSLFFWIAGAVFFWYSDEHITITYHLFILWVVYVLCTSALNGILIKKVL